MVICFWSDSIRSVQIGSNLIKLDQSIYFPMRINVPRSICSLICVSHDLFCCRLCNWQKTAALNVVIMNTFSQNLPDFLQNHLKIYPIFFKLHIWCHFSDIWYFIIKSRKNSDLFRFLARDLAKALNMLFFKPYPKFSTFSTFYKCIIFFIDLLALYDKFLGSYWIRSVQNGSKWTKLDQIGYIIPNFPLFQHFTNS